MTNYNELSEFEINTRVAKYKYPGEFAIYSDPSSNSRIIINYPNSIARLFIDYCNSWNDIGPILIGEGFDLINKLDGTTCIQDPLFEGDFDLMPEAIDENPCKAIAICYLMKKDAENDKES